MASAHADPAQLDLGMPERGSQAWADNPTMPRHRGHYLARHCFVARSNSVCAFKRLRGNPMTPLEKLKAMKMPFAELKGVEFLEAEPDRVVARMVVRPDLCTLGHLLHGGAVMAFADSVGAAATVINLPEDAKGTTTLESKTNFIGGAKEGATVIATATPIHRGRRTQVWQTRLETGDGKLVAVVTQTQMVL
jgi:uncharacterized protein (TIGR00369 family)